MKLFAQKKFCSIFKNNTMKIPHLNGIKKTIGITIAAGSIVFGAPAALKAQNAWTKEIQILQKDTFQHSKDSLELPEKTVTKDSIPAIARVPASGTSDKAVLDEAPSPVVYIAGERKKATIVVDLSKNVLYYYHKTGVPLSAYLVASGRKKYPTDTGIRVVTHIERYPYKTASPKTKRYKKPWDYGPRVICLETVDPKTGSRGKTGEFIHGNNNPSSLGKYASLGCVRMDNTVIKQMAGLVKPGDIVVMKR